MNIRWQLNCNKTNIFTAIMPLMGVALMATIAPASAQIVVMPVGVVNQPHPPAGFIYGSPIPTPTLVDPTTGLLPSTNYSYPGRGTVVNSTLINPTLVNPTIQNSTLINPLIVNEQFYQPVYGTRVLRRSGIIFNYPY